MSDSIKRLDLLRSYYTARSGGSSSDTVRELKEIKAEIKAGNDEMAYRENAITNATGSPYLNDQTFQKKDVVYNSPKETDWREVKSYEQAKDEVLIFKNLRKLNII